MNEKEIKMLEKLLEAAEHVVYGYRNNYNPNRMRNLRKKAFTVGLAITNDKAMSLTHHELLKPRGGDFDIAKIEEAIASRTC